MYAKRMLDQRHELVAIGLTFVSLAPYVSRISLLSFHLLDVLLRLVFTHIAFRLDDVEQNVSHICCHVLCVTGKSQKNTCAH
jgi:hypothetical protein